MIKSLTYLLIICFLCACGNQEPKQEKTIKTKFQLPAGAIPIRYIKNHIYIEGSVDGEKGSFLFDTGADNFYFDSVFFNRHNFNYQNIATAMLPGVGSTPQKTNVILDTVSFQFGNKLYQTKTVPVFGLKEIVGDYADGIIGKSYFSNKVMEINYEHEYIKLYDSIEMISTDGFSKIQFIDDDKRLIVPLKIQANNSVNIEGNFVLDLGSGHAIIFTSPVAKQFDLAKNIEQKVKYETKYGGVGGQSARYDFMAGSVKIGDYQLNNFVGEYSTDTQGALSSDKHFGLFGHEILDRFDVIIDFNNSDLYLKPNSYFNDKFMPSRLGFNFVDRSISRGFWNVTGFYEDSPAVHSGLQIDDKITHLNDQPVTEIDYKQQHKIFSEAETIKLTVSRNQETLVFNIQLKDVI